MRNIDQDVALTAEETVARAAAGDVAAARQVIQSLVATDPAVERPVFRAIITSADPALWKELARWTVAGQWARVHVPAPMGRFPRAVGAVRALAGLARDRAVPAVTRAAADLASASDAVDRRAAAELAHWHPGVLPVEALARLMDDPELAVRVAAARALAELHDPAALPALVHTLDRDDESAVEAEHALIRYGRAATSALLAPLGSEHAHTRWLAARALRAIVDPACARALAERLDDEDAGVRWLAADGLNRLGTDGVKAALDLLARQVPHVWVAEGAYHVLRGEPGLVMARLCEAVTAPERAIEVPLLAQRARAEAGLD